MKLNRAINQFIFLLVISILISSCSNRQLYDAIQKNQKSECQRLPSSQHEECMKGLDETYDSYEKKRKEAR